MPQREPTLGIMPAIDESFFSNKRILLLGGRGFIGQNLIPKLVSLKARIKVITRTNAEAAIPGAELISLDSLQEFEELQNHLAWADIIINLIQDSKNDYTINMNLAGLNLRILDFCAVRNKGAVLVNLGSRFQYSPNSSLPLKEDYPTQPINAYGLGKLFSEQYFTFFNKEFGLKTICLRVSTLYGQSKNPESRKGLIDIMVSSALMGKITIEGDANRLKDLLYIDDFSEALLLCLQNQKCYGEIINIGSGEGISLKEIAQKVKETFNPECKIDFISQNKDDFSFYLDIKKIHNITGWLPQIKLEEGLLRLRKA